MLLGRHRFAGDLTLSVGLPFVAIGFARGDYLWRNGDQLGDLTQQPALFQPEDDVVTTIDHADVEVVGLDVGALERTASALFGDDTLRMRFLSSTPVDAAAGRHWRAVAQVAWSAVDQDGGAGFDNDLLRASLYRQLAVATIETFPLAGDHEARRTTVASRAAAFKRAVGYIDAHASLPITLDDIAIAAGTSPAELDRAFDMHLPFTTEQYLGSVRLSAARRDLSGADPAQPDAIAAVAARWGFADARVFSRRYRERYGETPQETLLG
jgi:AraC-like DNA-binding protein